MIAHKLLKILLERTTAKIEYKVVEVRQVKFRPQTGTQRRNIIL